MRKRRRVSEREEVMVGSVHGGTHAGPLERATHNDEPGSGNVGTGRASRTGSEASFNSMLGESPGGGGERPILEMGNHQGTMGIPLRHMPQNPSEQPTNASAMDTGAPGPSQSHAPATGTTGERPQLGSDLATPPQNTLQLPLSPHSQPSSLEGRSSAGNSGTGQQQQHVQIQAGMAPIMVATNSTSQNPGSNPLALTQPHAPTTHTTGGTGGGFHQGTDPEAQNPPTLANPSFVTRHPTVAWAIPTGLTAAAATGAIGSLINTKAHGG